MSPLQVVCPFCHAAIGTKCMEKVRDGSKFVDWFHPERVVEAARQRKVA